ERAEEVVNAAVALYRSEDIPEDEAKLSALYLSIPQAVETKAKYALFDEILALAQRLYGDDSLRYVAFLSMVSKELVFTNEIDRGIAGLERSLKLHLALGVPESGWPYVLTKTILAEAWSRIGKHQVALRAVEEAITSAANLPGHSRLMVMASRPIVLLNAGSVAEAEAGIRDVIARRRALLGDVYEHLDRDQSTLALILARQGRCQEAQPLAEAGLRNRHKDPLFFGWRAQQAILECLWTEGKLEAFSQLLTASKALALPRESFEILRYIDAMEPRLAAALKPRR
ncbi:MAG: hypothetical protein AAFV29_11820, partial [Myxococcota bacterium]